MGVDYSTDLSADTTSRGRKSVRIQSKKIYNGGLFIADIYHMPGNVLLPTFVSSTLIDILGSICGVWPALSVTKFGVKGFILC